MSSSSPSAFVGRPTRTKSPAAARVAGAAVALLASACGSHHGPSATGTTMPPRVVVRPAGGGRTLPVTVNGATCSAASYVNKPCVEVTVCEPGGASCVAVGDVLLDTGSYGLRIFGSVLPLTLPQVTVPVGLATASLAACVQFADGSADWGPIRTADLFLGDAGPVTTAIQVIDAGFGHVPAACGQPDTSPAQAGLNGILGVGPWLEDCGPGCAVTAANGLYYGCTASACTGVAVAVAQQVKNPAALLPGLDSGLVIDLPGVAPGGAPSVSGHVYFGIGPSTIPATSPGGATAYPISVGTGGIPAVAQRVNGVNGAGFLDTGSNALYFTAPAGTTLVPCTAPYTGFYCSDAVLSGAFSTGGGLFGPAFSVDVTDLRTLLTNRSSNVYDNLAGTLPGLAPFDWGLPFYLGRRVYQGYETRTSSLGTGPYQAF